MNPAIIAFDGELDVTRFPEVHAALEAAKAVKGRAIVLDLSAAGEVDALVAGEILLFVRRSLRYGATVAIVPPAKENAWITAAESIREAHFSDSRDAGLAQAGLP